MTIDRRMVIAFDMNNAAFDENAPAEIVRVLRALADRLERSFADVVLIRDGNGNAIGKAEFVEESM